MEVRRWRCLVMPPQSGAWNMAWDEALARCCEQGLSPPTVRLYRWSPPCVSIGYFQSLSASVNREECRREGVEWIRRPTGGRALLHDEELTYAIAVPLAFWAGEVSVVRSYRELSQAFFLVLQELGLRVAWGEALSPSPRGGRGEAFCLATASRADLLVEGRKLVGSAQRRWHGVLLQHGSLPLRRDPQRVSRLIPTHAQAHAAWTSLEELGIVLPFEEWVERLRRAWERTLGIALAFGEPTAEEWEEAHRLWAERYSSPQWNERVP